MVIKLWDSSEFDPFLIVVADVCSNNILLQPNRRDKVSASPEVLAREVLLSPSDSHGNKIIRRLERAKNVFINRII